MQKGEIFYHVDFKFEDGGSAPKLLVLLNVPRNKNEPYLFCKTTSNVERKSTQVGCQINQRLFYIPQNTDFFEKDTWLELYYIAPFDAASVLRDFFAKALIIKGKLKDLTVRQIVNCIKNIRLSEIKYKEMILNS